MLEILNKITGVVLCLAYFKKIGGGYSEGGLLWRNGGWGNVIGNGFPGWGGSV